MLQSLGRFSPPRAARLASLCTALCLGLFVAATPVRAASPDGFEDLAEKLLPVVVNVSTTSKVKAENRPQQMVPDLPQLPPGSPFEDFFKDFYDQYKNQQPQQRDEKVSALGSGFIIDAANGYIVTNNHVIKGADEIKIITHDDETLDATLVGADEKVDIAVLKVKSATPLVAASWGDSDASKVGSWVIAIGNPFGLGGTVTAGIVSARQRDISAGPYDDFIQTDASINRGNSGGPMFNMKGEVVGVNTAIFSPSGGSVGIGFAVPSNIVKGVVEQLIKYGKTRRGWLGVKIRQVTPDIAEGLGLGKARGAMVAGLTEKGPSEAAGIKAGDIILTFDGKPVDTSQKLPRMVAETEIGKKVTLGVWRKGETISVPVTLGQLETAEEAGQLGGEKPGEPSPDKTPSTAVTSLGIGLAPLTDAAREKYGIDKKLAGVLVADVTEGGAAAEKGIAEGDVIVEIDQTEVAAPKDIVEKVAAAEKAGHASVLLFVARKQDLRFIALKPKK